MVGLAADGADIVDYYRNECLKPLIRAHFGIVAIIQ